GRVLPGEGNNSWLFPPDGAPPFRLIHLPLWKTPWAPRCSKEVSHERRRLSGPASQHNLLAALCLGTTTARLVSLNGAMSEEVVNGAIAESRSASKSAL